MKRLFWEQIHYSASSLKQAKKRPGGTKKPPYGGQHSSAYT